MHKIRTLAAGICLIFNAACVQTSQTPDAPRRDGDSVPNRLPTEQAETLRFHNLHTDENIAIPYSDGQSITRQANWFMRDFRLAEPAAMDPRLFALLTDLQEAIEARYPHLEGKVEYQVVSAYRAPATNENLRSAGGGQAKDSLHTHGQAIDIRVPGLSTAQLRDVASSLKLGGVGYYPKDRFVHVDVGRVRYW